MCDFEEFAFMCGCAERRLKSYCHFARNDPNHQCFGVKRLRDIWEQQGPCDKCAPAFFRRLEEQHRQQLQLLQSQAYILGPSCQEMPAQQNGSINTAPPSSGKTS